MNRAYFPEGTFDPRMYVTCPRCHVRHHAELEECLCPPDEGHLTDGTPCWCEPVVEECEDVGCGEACTAGVTREEGAHA